LLPFEPAVDFVSPPLPEDEDPRGTARPDEDPPPFDPPPRRWSSARSDRGAGCRSGRELPPIQPAFAPELSEPDPLGADPDVVEPPPEGAGLEDEDPPPLSRGTADPTVSPFDGREPACPAHAGARLKVKAEAISPTVSF
jgi:hypothetical protein